MPAPFGARRDDYHLSGCTCEIPVPIQVNAYGNGEPAQYACTECGHALNGDTNDAPYRETPGDLVSGAVLDAKRRRDEPARLRTLVAQLPLFEQRRLRGLTGHRWTRAALEAVRRTMITLRENHLAPPPDVKPHRRPITAEPGQPDAPQEIR